MIFAGLVCGGVEAGNHAHRAKCESCQVGNKAALNITVRVQHNLFRRVICIDGAQGHCLDASVNTNTARGAGVFRNARGCL